MGEYKYNYLKIFKSGDIVFVSGDSLISEMIKFCSTDLSERKNKEKTIINHVGIIYNTSELYNSIIIEALHKVKMHNLHDQYFNTGKKIAIYRPVNISSEKLYKIVTYAHNQVNKRYGYLKIVTHFMDWLTGGCYLFRRLTHSHKYPICSWLVAYAYASEGFNFGVDPGQATPDDIWDFCINNPDKYECVLSLQEI